jgi:hypothetical protein
MFVPLAAIACASLGQVYYLGSRDVRPVRPIATAAPYPSGMADDVRRPGFNGRLWLTRPIMGSMQQGPYPIVSDPPGPEAYGAFDRPDATVYARVGHLVVGVNAWESIDQEGLKRLEAARNFWLKEEGYTGGVRTIVNDANLWPPKEPEPAPHANAGETPAAGTPVPRATITLPADLPRQHRRIRVEAVPSPSMLPGAGPARVSWPDAAPAGAVARSESRGGLIGADTPARVITQATK